TRSGWAAPVARMASVTVPLAVRMVSLSGSGRSARSSISLIAIAAGNLTWRAKVIWIHWPTGVVGFASVHTVFGLPSKALTGSNCGDSLSHDPVDDAVTEAAPDSTATV